ncbi:MAG: tetratricopeptide repeat protein, partial [Acidobacteria bacterium]|nr:tetratricopeptide repeat protein [Acidobacteriota bacterium]
MKTTAHLGKVLWLCFALLFLPPVWGIPETYAQLIGEQPALSLGSSVVAQLRKGEIHRYPIALNAGQYLCVEAIAVTSEIILELTTPDGRKLMKAKARSGAPEGNTAVVVAEITASYFVKIAATNAELENVEYRIRLVEMREASAQDRARCQGDYLFAAGEELYGLRTREIYPAAIEKYEVAFSFYQQAGDWYGMALAIETKGVTLYALGNYSESLAAFEQSLPLIRKAGTQTKVLTLEANITNNIGGIYYSRYDRQTALAYFLQAAGLYARLGNQGSEASCLSNIASIYCLTGQPEESLKWYEQALQIQLKLDNRLHQAIAHHGRASAYFLLEKYEDAIQENLKGLELWKKLGNNSGRQALALRYLAENYLALQQPQKALEYLEQAMLLTREGGTLGEEAVILHLYGEVWQSLGDISKALDYFRQAQALRLGLGERILEAKTHAKIAQAEASQENYSEALSQSARSLDLIENVRHGYSNFMLGASYNSSIHNYYAEHIELLLELHRKEPLAGYDAQALQASERAQARSLLETLGDLGNDIRANAAPTLLEKERDLQQQLERLNSQRNTLRRGAANAERSDKLIQFENELRRLLSEYDQLQGQLRQSSPRYSALLRPQPLSKAEIQHQVLDSEAVLLEYFVTRTGIYLFALTKELPLTVVEIKEKKAIEQAAAFFKRRKFESDQELRARFSYANSEFRATTQLLSDKLLLPIAPLLKKRKIWIVGDGIIQQIPFNALPDPTAGEASRAGQSVRLNLARVTPLLVAHELAFLPSASTIAWLRKANAQRPMPSGLIAVLADPVFSANDQRVTRLPRKTEQETNNLLQSVPLASDAGKLLRDGAGETEPVLLSRLSATRAEALAIAALAPASQRLVALDFAANREVVINGGLNRFRYLHFA